MSEQSFQEIPGSLIKLIYSSPFVWILILAGSSGCSGEPGVEELLELMAQNPPHTLSAEDQQIEIQSIESAGDQRWNLKFVCQETPVEDWLMKQDPDGIVSQDSTEAADFEAALHKLTELRSPEKSEWELLQREIQPFRLPQIFQIVCRKGMPVKWKANAIVDQTGATPSLTISEIRLSDGIPLAGLIEKSALPKGAAVADGSPSDPIRQYAALRQRFITGVSAAASDMELRLAAERQALAGLLQNGIPLQGKLIPSQSEPQDVVLLVEKRETDDVISAVAIDVEDELSRVVFSGKLQLPVVAESGAHARRQIHDGWQLTLKNEDFRLSKLSQKIRKDLVLFYDTTRQTFRLSDLRNATPLQLSQQYDFAEVLTSAQLEEAISAGMLYRGRESITGKPDRSVNLSLTEYDLETGLLRIVLEDSQTPFTFAVFEGKLMKNPPHHLGIAIQLAQVTTHSQPGSQRPKSGLFSRDSGNRLLLIPTAQGLRGRFAQAELTFEKISSQARVLPAEVRWQQTLVPGSVWKGVTKWREEAAQRATLRVAESREGGKYLRITLERDDDPVQQVVYEGSILSEDAQSEGYGLVMQQFGTASVYEHEYFGVFFSRWQSEDQKVFRISPDGKTLYGLSTEGEVMLLERDSAEVKSNRQTTSESLQAWKQALTEGKVWEGTIRSVKEQQTAELKMIVKGYELEGEKVTLEFVPKVNRKARAVFEGSLDTSDKAINGYGLVLKKTLKFDGPGNVFGRWETQLQFRLDATGKRMIGRTNDHGDTEYLDLHLVEMK